MVATIAAAAERPVIVQCPDCRDEHHTLCTSPVCTCPDARRHRNRPGYAGKANGSSGAPAAANGPAPRPPEPLPAPAPTGGKAKPHWELVLADPPAKTPPQHKVSLAERARPFLEDIVASGSRAWHRVAIYPTPSGACMAMVRLSKRYRASEWEWDAVALREVGQSGLYVRWTGVGKVL